MPYVGGGGEPAIEKKKVARFLREAETAMYIQRGRDYLQVRGWFKNLLIGNVASEQGAV